MTDDHDTPDDAAAFRARRDMLSDFIGAVSAAVHAFAMPRSFRDAERATRVVTIGDRAIQRVATSEDPAISRLARAARLAFRDLGDKVMAHAHALPLPASFLDSERAYRYALSADRMLCQLYQPPKLRRRAAVPTCSDNAHSDDVFADALGIAMDDDLDAWKAGLERMLLNVAAQHEAPGGTATAAAMPAPQTISVTATRAEPPADAKPAAIDAPSWPPRPPLSRSALLNGAAAFPP